MRTLTASLISFLLLGSPVSADERMKVFSQGASVFKQTCFPAMQSADLAASAKKIQSKGWKRTGYGTLPYDNRRLDVYSKGKQDIQVWVYASRKGTYDICSVVVPFERTLKEDWSEGLGKGSKTSQWFKAEVYKWHHGEAPKNRARAGRIYEIGERKYKVSIIKDLSFMALSVNGVGSVK